MLLQLSNAEEQRQRTRCLACIPLGVGQVPTAAAGLHEVCYNHTKTRSSGANTVSATLVLPAISGPRRSGA